MEKKLDNITPEGFFDNNLEKADKDIFSAMAKELHRQQSQIELIASENIVSKAVLEAQGSIMTNKYAEGYPSRRYYGGCEYVDIAEELAIERACSLFEVNFANVQPHSGSQANQAVYTALLMPGDTILGMSLAAGGHLTHGAKPNQSGKWFNSVQYGVRKTDSLIDIDEVKELAIKHKPKLIIAGGSAYPRHINFKDFREIADLVGAYLLVDMAHFSGLVAGKSHPNPFPYADVATTTTHKVLRGPRGGLILTNNEEISKKINSAIFPGIQGGPLMHTIAAKAVSFGESLQPEFHLYTENVLKNANALSSTLMNDGFDIVSGGTDTHIVLVDLRPKGIKGNIAEESLGRAGITCNKNSVPFDPEKPMITSGIRLGSPACTTRGFNVSEFNIVGDLICEVLNSISNNNNEPVEEVEKGVKIKVEKLCSKFPIYEK
ncbi:MAG: serine hydroxymethyltransferase [Rhizobiales bacterium TMED94]|nr:serine hydroxymethyltransferase [Rhodobiaceae bacterium]RPF86023.1 MAG: serine hydroxymethyltransferase [Rhizobiales bacterium TMED94]|tara:strand:+ start:223 stop:1524 length:1302 start_codon:yes stop_codon:yes gene_type:complete